jgi:hypothetical protein
MPDEQWYSLSVVCEPITDIYTHVVGDSSIDTYRNGELVRTTPFDAIVDDPGPPSPMVHFDDVPSGSLRFTVHKGDGDA